MNKPTVIYVLGAGSSGSTILGEYLGRYENVVNIGELSHIDRYLALNLECQCGADFRACGLWSSISPSIKSSAPISPVIDLYRLILQRSKVSIKDPNFCQIVDKSVEYYSAVAEMTGAEVIVDTSKDLARFYYLYLSGAIHLVPVFVVRDVREYIISTANRKQMGTIKAYSRWMKINVVTHFLLKRLKGGTRLNNIHYQKSVQGVVKVANYQELVENIEELTNQILEGAMGKRPHIEDTNAPGHAISGTKSKFSKVDKVVAYDWKTKATWLQRVMFKISFASFWVRYFT